MTRTRVFTDAFYEEAVQVAWDAMRQDAAYDKAQILQMAGFEPDQTQHWAKLRRASGRLGLAIQYTSAGWRRGSGAGIVHEWDEPMMRHARSMRQNIIGHLQKSDGAQQAVAYLLEQNMDPLAAPVILRAYGAGLPEDVVRELASATQEMLPQLSREDQDKLRDTSGQIRLIAGLLAG